MLKVAVLFSGGAASVFSLHLSLKAGLEVEYLVTMGAAKNSRMYRRLDPDLARISARSIAVHQIELFVDGNDEVSPLVEALDGLDIDGLCDGAVASNYRRNRLAEVCRKLDIQLVLPLWHKDPAGILANMVDEGFKIVIVRLRSDRLEESWLGRVFDRENLDEFLQACEKNGISPLGELCEFETLVLSGPDMLRRPGRRGPG